MVTYRKACMVFAGLLLAAPATANEPAKAPTAEKDPNEKICENQTVIGSRLARRRVCATRGEWVERRRLERDIVDRTQMQRCVVNPSTGLCGGQ